MYEGKRECKGARGTRIVRPRWRVGCGEDWAQATVEYAVVTVVCVAIALGLAALWHAGANGVLARLARDAASHALSLLGAVDIALY